MMQYIEQLRELASKDQYIHEIKGFIDNLVSHDKSKALQIARTLFFAPETHPRVRYVIAERLGKVGSRQLFQQLLSYFILRKFPDTLSLLAALKSYADAEALPALSEYYPGGSYRECLEIIDTLAQTQAPETVELLSQIYNEQIVYQQAFERDELENLRQRASAAMGKQMMRFDFGI